MALTLRAMLEDTEHVLCHFVCNPFRVGLRLGEILVAARGLPRAIF
jgi:hypothetical protein